MYNYKLIDFSYPFYADEWGLRQEKSFAGISRAQQNDRNSPAQTQAGSAGDQEKGPREGAAPSTQGLDPSCGGSRVPCVSQLADVPELGLQGQLIERPDRQADEDIDAIGEHPPKFMGKQAG